MKRYIIMFGITIILALIIIFYNPFLGSYKNSVNIEYDFNEEGYEWNYEINGDSLKVKDLSSNHWLLTTNKNGITNITFTYSKDDDIKYEIYYKFRVFGKRIFWLEGSGSGLFNYPNPY